MTFAVQIAHGVEEVGQEAWDRLAGGRPFASYRWYRYGQVVLDDDLPIYVILSRRGEPVARGTFWLRRREQLPISSRLVRALCDLVLARRPLLVCQSPLVEASGLVLPRDPHLAAEAARTICRVIQVHARERRASFVLFDYLGEHEATHVLWPPALRVVALENPGTCLSVTRFDVESYLRKLGGSAWKEYRRNRNRARDLGIEVSSRSVVQSLEDAVIDGAVEQIWSVDRRHNTTPTPWARRMLKHAPMVDATWISATVNGRLVGCGTLVGDGDVRKMALLGRDPQVRYVYFQLLYGAIQSASEEGVRELWGGSGGYETKQRLGFQRMDNDYVAFAGAGPLLHRLGQMIGGMEEGTRG